MAKVTYTYSISIDFPNHKVDPSRLYREITYNDSITIALDSINTVDDACNILFKADLSAGEHAVLDGLVAAHSGEPLPEETLPVRITSTDVSLPINTTTPLIVNSLPPSGLKRNIISMNWCDKTTWWYNAKPVVNEIPTVLDGYRKEWKLSHDVIIDVYHGKLTGENSLSAMRVAVTLDGYTLTEQDPHYGTGGDFVVNYRTGTITLSKSAPVGKDPLVSYYYEDGSLFVISPGNGEVWKLKGAESQFSDDVEMTDTLVYEVWAYNTNDLPNKVMVAAPDEYKTIYDFINDSNKAYPIIPALGGTGWRGSPRQISVFSWDFQTTTDLSSSYGMELRIYLQHDTPFNGTFSTGTFYFIRENE